VEIRSDFKSAESLLSRLVQYSKVFNQNNMENWSHLKNNEDFRTVYTFDWSIRRPLENIYADGRDLAVFMSNRLVEFNYPEYFSTLKQFVDSFQGDWIYQINQLKNQSQEAKDICLNLEYTPWAMDKMINLFDDQIGLLIAIKQTIEGLKETDLYKWEGGNIQTMFPVPQYEKIFECIHSIGKMFERLPSTYEGKNEESLRDHILVSLETVVLGTATGETFNKRGKTDILVRNAGDNEFVGECKFWGGKSIFLDTITQVLGYLSWRDTNTAVIIFVKNTNFTAVLKKVEEYISEHPNYLGLVIQKDESWYSYEFRSNEDHSRIINMAVMLYHTPESS